MGNTNMILISLGSSLGADQRSAFFKQRRFQMRRKPLRTHRDGVCCGRGSWFACQTGEVLKPRITLRRICSGLRSRELQHDKK